MPSVRGENPISYRESLEALRAFSRHESDLEAKRQYSLWYKGCDIVGSELLNSYGDDRIDHVMPNQRAG